MSRRRYDLDSDRHDGALMIMQIHTDTVDMAVTVVLAGKSHLRMNGVVVV